ncbi:hypothetical protein [Streptomyces fodineus]|uniref:hypothetical protein n=1 Tax=Streptomyces fodineus TaxID=1904616 RepID=UPI001D04F682|nr:hypothetical protein [Streptomyces fodineus]
MSSARRASLSVNGWGRVRSTAAAWVSAPGSSTIPSAIRSSAPAVTQAANARRSRPSSASRPASGARKGVRARSWRTASKAARTGGGSAGRRLSAEYNLPWWHRS